MGDTYTISLPNGDAFNTDSEENLLAAAQRAHWLVRYGCRNGNCEACAATLLRGRVTQRGRTIDAAQQSSAHILLCLCHAQTDLQIDLPGAPQHGSAQQSQRRYARVTAREEIAPSVWRLQFALPAGRQPTFYSGQYAEIESTTQPDLNGCRINIDARMSSGRKLQAISEQKLELAAGDYVHLRYPLGYCYAATTQVDALILFEPNRRLQAQLLQSFFAQSDFPHASVEIQNVAALPQTKLNSTILACADTETARSWYEALLAHNAEFAEFRCDDAIWRRWRVQRQDDNGNRFTVVSGLSESEARIKIEAMESHGHKQLYWAEPIM